MKTILFIFGFLCISPFLLVLVIFAPSFTISLTKELFDLIFGKDPE